MIVSRCVCDCVCVFVSRALVVLDRFVSHQGLTHDTGVEMACVFVCVRLCVCG